MENIEILDDYLNNSIDYVCIYAYWMQIIVVETTNLP